ncbi:MAG TPA: MmgE/PrpD family protein [Bosea sp. (in: a-proteobacteria)]|nr:MmgE/PrpD family protein [Bosea sp. (in: a-proteobacteria)]
MAQAGLTGDLARFITEVRWDQLPERTRHEAKRSLLNFFATAISGSREPAIELAIASLREFGGNPRASVIGRSDRLDALGASFVNAASANIADFDDTHVPTVIHPSAPVAPPLFALAERRRMSGKDLLTGFAVGVEIACRLGNAVFPSHYRRGWHITATCGVLGAAAAASHTLSLDRQKTVWALGLAATQSTGLVESLGTMAKSVSIGSAARNGLWSALLADQGFDGPAAPIEGSQGFLAVMVDKPDLTALTAGLGEGWQLARNTYKPYPCGVVINPVIDACLLWRAETSATVDDIEAIIVTGNPLLLQRADRPSIASGREAQVSAQHAVAASLLKGKPGLAEFSDQCVRNPAVMALRTKVSLVSDPAVGVDAARLVFRLRDGQERTIAIDEARGSLARALSDAELEAKFEELTARWIEPDARKALVEAIWTLDRAEDAAGLLALTRPA